MPGSVTRLAGYWRPVLGSLSRGIGFAVTLHVLYRNGSVLARLGCWLGGCRLILVAVRSGFRWGSVLWVGFPRSSCLGMVGCVPLLGGPRLGLLRLPLVRSWLGGSASSSGFLLVRCSLLAAWVLVRLSVPPRCGFVWSGLGRVGSGWLFVGVASVRLGGCGCVGLVCLHVFSLRTPRVVIVVALVGH